MGPHESRCSGRPKVQTTAVVARTAADFRGYAQNWDFWFTVVKPPTNGK